MIRAAWHRLNHLAEWGCLLIVILLLAGCADRLTLPQAILRREAVGFWYGLWHGLILPVSWLVSLFDKHVAIYAVYNSGSWYDSGFALGCAVLFGGLSRK
jgi:hypothetical protein